MRQQIETVPLEQIKHRIAALNAMGREVVAITIDREREQFWVVTSPSGPRS